MGMQVSLFHAAQERGSIGFSLFWRPAERLYRSELIGNHQHDGNVSRGFYRPEIYNANSRGRDSSNQSVLEEPRTTQSDAVVYDREERSQLAVQQGKYAEEHSHPKPYQERPRNNGSPTPRC